MPQTFTINSRKADNKIHRSWQAELIEETGDYLTFVGKFSETVLHPELGEIVSGTVSYEFYWRNSWYNVFRFHEPNGELRNFYCNVNQPPKISGQTLDYVDLDIDILVSSNGNYRILDLDEFDANSKFYKYSQQTISNAKTSVKEVINLIETRKFPFDYLK